MEDMRERAPTATELLERLVAFDTTSRRSNLELIDFVADHLDRLGVPVTLIHDETGEKANLYATLGPRCDGGVVLSGHTDVVPVDGQDWRSDPFRVRHSDDRLYGRGTADMKGFIAVALALAPEMLAGGLRTPIHFAFSYDEEVGCTGVHGLIRHIGRDDVRPGLVVVGEPTGMKVVNAHKGCLALNTEVTGFEAHSSATHLGVNAVSYAAELIACLDGLGAEMKARARPDSRFEPPHTTVHVGTVEGGTARNIIPKSCRFRWEVRALPGSGEDDEVRARFEAHVRERVLPRMRAVHPAADVATEAMAEAAGLAPDEDSPAESLALGLTGGNRTFAVSYCTEAGLFREAGLPAVVCGPGDIRQAHKPNEYIELAQIDACVAFVRRLIARLAAP